MPNETLAEFQGKTPIYREEKMKELFGIPACLDELVFWLRMLKMPQRILKEKFKPILSELGIDVQKTTRARFEQRFHIRRKKKKKLKQG
jgi:transposase